MKNKPIERETPTVFRHVLGFDWVREFTFKERIKILFGGTLKVVTKVACSNNPGKIQPVIAGEVSNLTSASEHLKQQMKDVLIDQKGNP
jgi:hypothetical protein